MRTLSVFTAVAALVLAGSAPAQAGTLRGQTHRGMHVKITTDAKGRATKAIYFWRVRRCDFGRYTYGGATAVDSKKRPAAHFFTSNPYTVRNRGGFRTRVTVHSTAHRLSIYRWKGTFSLLAVIRRHGHVVDRCRIHRLHWSASMPEARFDLVGQQNDVLVGPRSLSYRTPGTRITVRGSNPHDIYVTAGPWSLRLAPPGDRTFKPGRYRHATRFPSRRRAGLDFSGNGTGCNETNGEFTIKRVKFDRDGLRALVLSFVQRCDSAEGVDRGTLTYHR
jgi:hypothetical protein